MSGPDAIQAGQPERSRLVDHFKRLYTIVAGLAITEAVKRLFPLAPPEAPLSWVNLPFSAILMLATFLITIIPIFHGGDRSLDFKYLNTKQEKLPEKFAYIWDVYMLVITAILFVCIAESIPERYISSSVISYRNPALFYLFMSIMFGFDIFVLAFDYVKNCKKRPISVCLKWISLNFAAGFVCCVASIIIGINSDLNDFTKFDICGFELPFLGLSLVVFIICFLRTAVDYITGHEFLFP